MTETDTNGTSVTRVHAPSITATGIDTNDTSVARVRATQSTTAETDTSGVSTRRSRFTTISATETDATTAIAARVLQPRADTSDISSTNTDPTLFVIVSGTVSKNGNTVSDATVIAVNLATEELVSVTSTTADGSYTLPEVRRGTPLSVSVDYDDGSDDFGRQKTLDVQ